MKMKKLRSLLPCLALLINTAVHPVMAEDRVLCIGNSFTYVNDAPRLLSDIAASQGHTMKIVSSLEGGYTLKRHLVHDKTLNAISEGNFDYVFLQDQSQTPAYYAEAPRRCRLVARDARELADRVRIYSRDATIWMEQTWAYEAYDYGSFGSWEQFDRMLHRGAKKMARKAHARLSPIGEAFALCRLEHPEINLYEADHHHQSAFGAYLKACVNYLLIYHQPFTSEASNCNLDAQQAAALRHVAEKTVLKKKKKKE